jgi:hypothetical protein
VADVLVFDPASGRAWCWDRGTDGLVRWQGAYQFLSRPEAALSRAEVFRRLEEKEKSK